MQIKKTAVPIIIIGFVIALTFHFIAIAAIDAPHNESNSINCGSCHGQGLLNSPFWGGSMSYDELCRNCHKVSSGPYTETNAPLVKTHSSENTDEQYGVWSWECRNCHDAHYQKQKNYKSTDAGNLYLATGTITGCSYNAGDNESTLTYSSFTYKTGWDATRLLEKTGEYRRTILFPNVGKLGYSYPVIAIDTPLANTITVTGDARPVYQYMPSSTFAMMYGQYVKDSINNSQVKLFDGKGAYSFADGDTTYNGVCEVCHTLTLYHRNDGTGGLHYAGDTCTRCHFHINGFIYSGESLLFTVHNSIIGTSPTFLGANEGGGFRVSDLADSGINLYRIWTTMGELEYYDDDWVSDGYPGFPTYPSSSYYGNPTIEQIKADFNIIPWHIWDDAFTRNRWTTATPFKDILDGCKTSGIEPLLVLRTKGPGESWIDWIPNAPDGNDFWQEWWEYCFAVAYWCNVRNSYNVTHFQIHNEPDLPSQGWQGTQTQYVQLLEYARDALEFANGMVGLPVNLHAPIVSNYASSYISYSLDNADNLIDRVDYHVYDKYHSLPTSIQTVQDTISTHNPDGILEPVWISEWGDLDLQYDTLNRGLLIAEQLFQMAQGGVEGSAIFMLYDWSIDGSGLIDESTFVPYDSYYAFRLMLRGLQGGKDILEVDSTDPSKQIMVTKEGETIYVLAVDVGSKVTVDISEYSNGSGTAELYEYSEFYKDQISATPYVINGVVSFSAQRNAAFCLVINL